jgi:DNA-binding NtrC family response regulator
MAPRPRILLVDDDADVLDVAAQMLDVAGFEVVTAPNGMQALALLQNGERFAALVTDQSMPGLTGEQLVEQAGRLSPDMACLVVTGHGDTLGPGSFHVLRKPFRTAALAGKIREIIAEKE